MKYLLGHRMIRRVRTSSILSSVTLLVLPIPKSQLHVVVRSIRGKHTSTCTFSTHNQPISSVRTNKIKIQNTDIEREPEDKKERKQSDRLVLQLGPEDLDLGTYIPSSGFTSLRIIIIGRPTIISAESREMPKTSYYAVAQGRKIGIYTTWNECEDQVKSYPAAKFKKFPSEEQAKQYISSNSLSNSINVFASSSSSSSTSISTSTSTNHKVKPTTSTEKDTQFRSLSPATEAQTSSLPLDLEIIAKKGYTFSLGPPYYLIVYTDGSARGNGKVGSRAGGGVWWGSAGDAAARNISERVPGMPQTNNRGELLAVIRALEQCPYPDIPLEIRCDSQYTISCMTVWLPKWLSTNFKTSSSSSSYNKNNNNNNKNGRGRGTSQNTNTNKEVMNVDMIKHLLVLLRRRGSKGRVKFKYVPAHTGVEGNECADRLANMGAMMPPLEARTYWLNPELDVEQGIDTNTIPNSTTPAAAANAIDIPIPEGRGASREVTEIEVEMDENWLMTPEELAAFEEGFESE